MTMPMPYVEMEPGISLPKPCDPRGIGGLMALVNGAEQALPLAEVKVRADIVGGACRTVVEQRFTNTLETAMEAVHICPLPEEGAVVEMSLRCGDLVVEAECREKTEAKAIFDNARAVGHRAALLTQERDDVHTLRVTRLPAGEEVVVRLVIVEQLEIVDGQYRWRFPTTIAPRYLTGAPIGHEGPGVLPDTTHVPDASSLQPPLRLAGGTRLDLEVRVAGLPKRLASSLHCVSMSLEDGAIRVAPSGKATLNKDFALAFSVGAQPTVGARAWTDGQHTVVEVQPPALADPEGMPRDVVFVVDISGSMSGQKLDAAKAALSAALHGLVIGDRFKLIAFDDRLEVFQQGFAEYGEETMAAADAWISRLRARGGTEMLPAIKASLDGNTAPGRLRTVLFITDGQAWNEQPLVAAVANRRKGALFFTLGIDTAVNGALLKRLARVGGGTCELAAPSDDIDALITRFEARFGTPLADGVQVKGRVHARLQGGTLFAGRPVRLFIEGAPAELTITADEAVGGFPMSIVPERAPDGFHLGALWARHRVASLEDRLTLKPFEEEALRPQLIEVALAHRIASRFTSFVAVERTRVVEGPMAEVVQPTELPEGWDDGFKGAPPGSGGGGMPAAKPMRSVSKARKKKSSLLDLMPAEARKRDIAPPLMDAEMMECDDEASGAFAPDLSTSVAAPPMPAPEPMSSAPMPAMEGAAPLGVAPQQAPMKEEASRSRGAGLLGRLLGGLGGRRSQDKAPPPPAAPAGAAPTPPRAPAPMPAPNQGPARADAEAPAASTPADVEQALVKGQKADGSYGGDVARTAAALITLLLLGHTRQAGLRRRTVSKAARWLKGHAGARWADHALAALEAAEAGQGWRDEAALKQLVAAAGAEGRLLSSLLS